MSADCRFISILPFPLKSKWINKFALLSSVAAAGVTVATLGGGESDQIVLTTAVRGGESCLFLFFNNMPLRAKYLCIFVRHDEILSRFHFLIGLIETLWIAWSLLQGGVHKICVFDPKSPFTLDVAETNDISGMLMTMLILLRAQTTLRKSLKSCKSVKMVLKK